MIQTVLLAVSKDAWDSKPYLFNTKNKVSDEHGEKKIVFNSKALRDKTISIHMMASN